MKKRPLYMLVVICLLFAAAAGLVYADASYNIVGFVSGFNRAAGKMTVTEAKEEGDKTPAKEVEISDNERQVMKKRDELTNGSKVNLTYEKKKGKNVVKKFIIIPNSC